MIKTGSACSGCAACAYVCPQNAITMGPDKEGFLVPKIDTNTCVECQLCSLICGQISKTQKPSETWIVQSHKDEILKRATSGGAISTIAEAMIRDGGIVFGVAYDPCKGGRWLAVNDMQQLPVLSGSKYFQINLCQEVYENIAIFLSSNRKVLFIGTPCQVNAVKCALPSGLQDNLYTIDLVCGGVVSPEIEKQYIAHLSRKHGCAVTKHLFRSKANGWSRKYTTVVEYADGAQEIRTGAEDLFSRAFTSGRLMRKVCYQCSFANRERTGDVTVGDCWGEETVNHGITNIRKGLSLLLINTQKGRDLMLALQDSQFYQCEDEHLLSMNKPLNTHIKRPLLRTFGYWLYRWLPFSVATNIVDYRYLIKRLLGRTS